MSEYKIPENLVGLGLRGETMGVSWKFQVTHDAITLETDTLLTEEQYRAIMEEVKWFLKMYLVVARKVLLTLKKIMVLMENQPQIKVDIEVPTGLVTYEVREVNVKGKRFFTNLPKVSIKTAERLSKVLAVILAASREEEECLLVTKKVPVSEQDAKILSNLNIKHGAPFVRGELTTVAQGTYEYTITVGANCVELANALQEGLPHIEKDIEALENFAGLLVPSISDTIKQALEEWLQKVKRIYPVFMEKLSE